MATIQPFLDSTDVQDDGPELARRMARDGYLYVRGLLPVEQLESLRMQWLRIIRDAGWVKTDTPLEDDVADLNGFCVEPEPKYNNVYAAIYKLQSFHAILQHPQLWGLVERMAGAPVMAHPMLIARTLFPQREAYTTPPHQDFIPIQGTPDTYTAWLPLNDLQSDMGGLQICGGSHKHGVYDFEPALGAGGLAVTDSLDGQWVSNPVNQGDVVFFHSLVVHKGLPNTGQRLRLSIDGRFQKVSDPINPKCLEPHIGEMVTWEQIYANWPNDQYKYYWKSLDMKFAAFDTSYVEKRDEMAMAMAKAGDTEARSTLQRIIARDTNQAKIKRAKALLVSLEKG